MLTVDFKPDKHKILTADAKKRWPDEKDATYKAFSNDEPDMYKKTFEFIVTLPSNVAVKWGCGCGPNLYMNTHLLKVSADSQ